MNVRTTRESRSSTTRSATAPAAMTPNREAQGSRAGSWRTASRRPPATAPVRHERRNAPSIVSDAARDRAVVEVAQPRPTVIRRPPERGRRPGRKAGTGGAVGDRHDAGRPLRRDRDVHHRRVHVDAVADRARRRRRRASRTAPARPGARWPSGGIRLNRCVACRAPASIPATRLLVASRPSGRARRGARARRDRESVRVAPSSSGRDRDDADVGPRGRDFVEDLGAGEGCVRRARRAAGTRRHSSGCAPLNSGLMKLLSRCAGRTRAPPDARACRAALADRASVRRNASGAHAIVVGTERGDAVSRQPRGDAPHASAPSSDVGAVARRARARR